MRVSVKTLFYAFILSLSMSMTLSCSGTSSSTSEEEAEIIDSIAVYPIDLDVNPIDMYDMGTVPAGKEVREAVAIRNFDRERGARIVGIDGDNLVSKCKPSLDSIEPRMLIGVEFKIKVPEEKGPFDATMRINYKNVKNPSIIRLHGYAE